MGEIQIGMEQKPYCWNSDFCKVLFMNDSSKQAQVKLILIAWC